MLKSSRGNVLIEIALFHIYGLSFSYRIVFFHNQLSQTEVYVYDNDLNPTTAP